MSMRLFWGDAGFQPQVVHSNQQKHAVMDKQRADGGIFWPSIWKLTGDPCNTPGRIPDYRLCGGGIVIAGITRAAFRFMPIDYPRRVGDPRQLLTFAFTRVCWRCWKSCSGAF